jgi:hypothetical protein
MTQHLTPYVPGKKSFPPLPATLRASWEAITPSTDGKLEYRPCSVTLTNGTTVPCVYVMDAQSYIDAWGVWPEDDKGKRHISIVDVASISESPFRLPPRFANELYRAGESGMGYCILTLVFSDGTEQVCLSGNAIDFVQLPDGKSVADLIAVIPHKGRNAPYVESPKYSWCLFGEGSGAIKSSRYA